jgi:hypothetical protein
MMGIPPLQSVKADPNDPSKITATVLFAPLPSAKSVVLL